MGATAGVSAASCDEQVTQEGSSFYFCVSSRKFRCESKCEPTVSSGVCKSECVPVNGARACASV